MPFLRHTVPAHARGKRLDAFLASMEPHFSRSRLKTLIDNGNVTLDGRPAKPSKLLQGGETIDLAIEPPRPAALEPEALALQVLYEDSDVIVVDKPAGMVVHPGAGNPSGTLANALLAHCHDLAGIGGELRPGIIHRLDRYTSGCIIVAKNDHALVAMQAQFKGREVEKVYLALVHGAPSASGRFETLHGRHPVDRLRFTTRVPRGRQAITEWTLETRFQDAALLRVRLLTGRTHQIRVHFSEAGYPLLHDILYGGKRRETRLDPGAAIRQAAEAIGRQALHAYRIGFRHPTRGVRLSFEAPLPADFQRALELLRG